MNIPRILLTSAVGFAIVLSVAVGAWPAVFLFLGALAYIIKLNRENPL